MAAKIVTFSFGAGIADRLFKRQENSLSNTKVTKHINTTRSIADRLLETGLITRHKAGIPNISHLEPAPIVGRPRTSPAAAAGVVAAAEALPAPAAAAVAAAQPAAEPAGASARQEVAAQVSAARAVH
jgi:hypothetical protein